MKRCSQSYLDQDCFNSLREENVWREGKTADCAKELSGGVCWSQLLGVNHSRGEFLWPPTHWQSSLSLVQMRISLSCRSSQLALCAVHTRTPRYRIMTSIPHIQYRNVLTVREMKHFSCLFSRQEWTGSQMVHRSP
jgi:hypothetical protein